MNPNNLSLIIFRPEANKCITVFKVFFLEKPFIAVRHRIESQDYSKLVLVEQHFYSNSHDFNCDTTRGVRPPLTSVLDSKLVLVEPFHSVTISTVILP